VLVPILSFCLNAPRRPAVAASIVGPLEVSHADVGGIAPALSLGQAPRGISKATVARLNRYTPLPRFYYRFRGEADVDRPSPLANRDANDPYATLAATCERHTVAQDVRAERGPETGCGELLGSIPWPTGHSLLKSLLPIQIQRHIQWSRLALSY